MATPLLTCMVFFFLIRITTQQAVCESSRLDLIFVVDVSGSICDRHGFLSWPSDECKNFERVLQFLKDVVNKFTIGPENIHVAAMTFSNELIHHFHLCNHTNKADLLAAIDQIGYRGGETFIGDACNYAANKYACEDPVCCGNRPDVLDATILITDGNQNGGQLEVAVGCGRLQASSRVIAVGVGDKVDQIRLAQVASPPRLMNQDYFLSPNFEQLGAILDRLINQTCVEDIESESRTQEPILDPVCNSLIDVCFLVDESGSICDDEFRTNPSLPQNTCTNWEFIRNFLLNAVDALRVSEQGIHAGLVTFRHRAKVVFGLNNYSPTDEIRNYQYTRGGVTNMPVALREVGRNCFNQAGDRPDVLNVLITVTDGMPSEHLGGKPATCAEALILQKSGIHSIAIGVSQNVDNETLQCLASPPRMHQSEWFVAAEFFMINEQLAELLRQACKAPDPPPRPDDCESAIDICFLVDESGSICDEEFNADPSLPRQTCSNWESVRNFLMQAVGALKVSPDGVHVGMVTFRYNAKVVFRLDNLAPMNAIRTYQYEEGGITNMLDGLRVVDRECFNQAGDRPNVPNLLITITDGKPSEESGGVSETCDEAQRLQNNGIRSISIGITKSVDIETLKCLSSLPRMPQSDWFVAPEFMQINTVLTGLLGQACRNPDPPIADLDRCRFSADVCILVDESGSICDEYFRAEQPSTRTTCPNWERVRNFLLAAVDTFQISEQGSHMGLVTFRDKAKTVFGLNNFRPKDIIQRYQYTEGGTTNLPGGLRVVGDSCFNQAGDRPGVQNVLITVTDGKTSEDFGGVVATCAEAQTLQNTGLYALSVGITANVENETVQCLSSQPRNFQSEWFLARDFVDLQAIQQSLLNRACPSTAQPSNG